jgi:hypothetical protein
VPVPSFKRATRTQSRLRLALAGPAGSGKTMTMLKIAATIAGDKPVAVIDTERGSASKYSDQFSFDVLELETFHPQNYIDAIQAAADAGYGALGIDSLSHAWMGKDGALELVDRAAKRSQSGNSFGAWREVTPLHNALVDAMLRANLHIIVTLRSKQDYVQEKDDRGRTTVRKIGLAPVQRDGLEYEFDVYGDLDAENNLIIGKTRCPELTGAVIPKPGEPLAKTLLAWLGQGEPERIPESVLIAEGHRNALTDAGDMAALALAWNAVLGSKANLGEKQLDALYTLKESRKAELSNLPEAVA